MCLDVGSTVNTLVIVNTDFLSCWLFRQELLVCHVNQKEKRHAKTARYDRNRRRSPSFLTC
ncbi:TPA: hypothetical protein HGR20_19640 [Escherichia coli]|nr:hypothetical protein [Escherichia coli O100]EFW3609618.1 hypothetical protein [Shigella sonnei]QDM78709.1 hypothetical protein FNJ80_01395 [Escherichia coli]EFX5032119.1 hypothetical protein [Shigella sonnei]EGA7131419.1 hypothetical protein [Shigella sonnei]